MNGSISEVCRVAMWHDRLTAGEATRVAELAMPSSTDGWLVVGRGPRERERALLTAALPAFHSASIATLSIDLPMRTAPAAAWVRVAAAALRRDMAGGLPVAFLGTGASAGAAWVASRGGALDGVIAWNGQAGAAWTQLRHVQAPSLLVLDDGAEPWRHLLARTLCWRLADAKLEFISGRSPLDAGPLARWYWDRILSPPAPVFAASGLRPRSARSRVVTLGVAAALAIPTLGALTLPDFAGASTLSAHQIAGDSAPAAMAATAPKDAAGKRVSGSQILGDDQLLLGPFATGSQGLIDGIGLKHFVNTNITFSTTSSASGAMREASFTHAVAADTLNGGTAQSTLNDAYDGYGSICTSINNTVASCATGNANFQIYNKLGPATQETVDPGSGTPANTNPQLDFPPMTLSSGLVLSRKVYVPSNDAYARWLNIVNNPTNTAQTITLVEANNLGSDSNTKITDDSAGDTSPTAASTWVTTFQNWSGTTSSDPRLGHVLGSAGAPVPLAGIHFQDGDDHPFWGYTFTVAPGETKIIMTYGVAEPTIAASETKSAQLAAMSDPLQFDAMTAAEKSEVVNFALVPPTAVADSYSTPHDAALNQVAPGVLANDTSNSPDTAVLVTGPSNAASFALNSDGSFSYTPKAGFVGTDSFTYEAQNGAGLSPPATATITVVGVGPAITSAGAAGFMVGQAGSFTIRTTGLPTATITVSGALPSGLGFKDNGDGTATIGGTPASGTQGTDVLTIAASNGSAPDATQTLTLTIAAAAAVPTTTPAVPTATPQSYSTRPSHSLSEGAPGLLAGVSSQSPVHAVLVSGSTHGGTVTVSPDGAFTYEPKPGFIGTDSFQYAVADANGVMSAPATITITVAPYSHLAQINKIEKSFTHLRTSYDEIVASAQSLLTHSRNPHTASQARSLLRRAATLAERASVLEREVRAELVAKRPFGKALTDTARVRADLAAARKLAASARLLAAKARTHS